VVPTLPACPACGRVHDYPGPLQVLAHLAPGGLTHRVACPATGLWVYFRQGATAATPGLAIDREGRPGE
jgi:hypothetical protein